MLHIREIIFQNYVCFTFFLVFLQTQIHQFIKDNEKDITFTHSLYCVYKSDDLLHFEQENDILAGSYASIYCSSGD